MVIFRAALASGPRRAMLTMDLPRAMVLGAVKRDQHVSAKATEHVEATANALKVPDGCGEHRKQQRRGGWIEQVANMIFAGYFGYAEQAGAVGAAMARLEVPLVGKERRALHEEHREGRHADVGHAVDRVHAPALVREPVQATSQRSQQ